MLPPAPIDPRDALPEGAMCAVHPARPAYARCARCRAFACTACTRVLAAGDVLCERCELQEGGQIPFERRRELGLASAIARTVAGVLTRPHELFAQRTRERALWPALLFGLALHLVASAAQLGWNLAFASRIRAELEADPIARQMAWMASDEFFVAQLVLAPLAFLLGTYLMATLWWLGLRAVGGAKRGFHVIVRALCFAQSTAVLVPIVAGLALVEPIGGGIALGFGLWSVWIQIVAVSRMQGIEIARGALAFLLAISTASVLACIAGTGLLAAFASQIRIPNL